MAATTKSPLKVGILICDVVQLLDIAAIDLFAMTTTAYLRTSQAPDTIIEQGRDLEFHYIAEAGPGSHGTTTGDLNVLITDSFESVGRLDYLFVPGLKPTYFPPQAVQDFIRTKAKEVRALLVVCTGILPVVFSGVLSGKRCTAPREVLPILKQKAPDVDWTEKRWEVDEEGKIWTSGTVTNGLDMMAAYLRKNFPLELANFVCESADVGDRGQEYPTKRA